MVCLYFCKYFEHDFIIYPGMFVMYNHGPDTHMTVYINKQLFGYISCNVWHKMKQNPKPTT